MIKSQIQVNLMFAIERINKIKEMLFAKKRVDVMELKDLFSVTEVTIRRDLDKLEQMGILVKTYGGAVLNEAHVQSVNPTDNDELIEEKRMIGKIAAQLIADGEAIFLSPGTTNLEIARNLHDKRITVVTNDLSIGLAMKDYSGIKVIITGGDMKPGTSALVGGIATQLLHGIFISKAFVGVKGVHFDSGFTVDNYDEALVLQEVRKISGEFIVVGDYSKFNKIGFARIGDLSIAKTVITNKQVPEEYKKHFFENKVKLFTTFELE
jgi:DeoR family transcriptional regulator, fructose operon transcriptional repressor